MSVVFVFFPPPMPDVWTTFSKLRLTLCNQEAVLVSWRKFGMDGDPFPFSLQCVCVRGVPMQN